MSDPRNYRQSPIDGSPDWDAPTQPEAQEGEGRSAHERARVRIRNRLQAIPKRARTVEQDQILWLLDDLERAEARVRGYREALEEARDWAAGEGVVLGKVQAALASTTTEAKR